MKTLTFDKEESFLRGHIPLQKFKKQIETLKWESLEEIDFSGNGYCTDAVINIIRLVKKGILSCLQRVDLQGCQILTDVGVKWLSEILESANKLTQVNLDGCCLVSDVGLAHLLGVLPEKCHVSVIGTAVCCLTSARDKHVRTGGGSTLPPSEETTDFKQGGILVVPHISIKSSIAHILNGNMDVPQTGLHHVTTYFKDGWSMNINEVTLLHPFFDVLVRSNPIQVVIPFDSSADLNDVSKHVNDVVSKVIMKEPEHPFMEVGKFHSPFDGKLKSGDQFMDVKFVLDHKLDLENSVLENWPVTEAEKEVDGCFLSRTFFTKSHPYFQVQFIKKDNALLKFLDGELPDELLIGCVRDYYYAKMFAKPGNYYNRISRTEAKNVMVHRFSLKNVKKGDTFGFGIRGEWESEYNAGSSCKLFVTHNGTEVKYEGNPEDLVFNRFYYPCLAINSHFTCQFKLPHLSPPAELMNTYKKEQRWIRPCYTDFCVINNTGIISMNKHANKTSDAHFLSEQPVGTKDTPNTSFTVKVVEDPGDFKIKVGLVVEGYLQNSYTCYLVLHGHNGEVRCKTQGDSVNLVPSPTKLAVGDEIKFQWEIERQPITFHDTKEFPVKILRNGKLLCQTDYTFSFKGGLPEERVYVFLSSHSTNERRVQLLNYQPHYRPPVSEFNKITPAIQRGLQIYDDGVLLNKHDGSCPYMVSRTAINPKLTYFEMEVIASGNDGEIGLGLTHNMPDTSDTIGKSRYEIMFCTSNSAGTGKVFHMDVQKSSETLKFETGDVVGCGLEGKFGDDGKLVENSEVDVFFTINTKEIHRQKLPYRSDNLFPFFIQYSNSAILRIRGFTSDTVWNEFEFQPKDQKNLPTSVPRFSGCEFSVVDVTGGSNITALKNKVSLDKLPCIQSLKENMKILEGDLNSLNVEHQQRLSELHRAIENIDQLSKSPERVKFLSLKLSTKEGVEAMKKAILNKFLSHIDLQRPIFSLPQTLLRVVESTRKELKSQGICQVVDNMSVDHSCPTLYERIKYVSPSYLTGEMFMRLVERMFHQGDLIVLQTDCGLLAVDLEFAAKSVESLINFSKVENLKTGITAFGEKSIVWKADIKDQEKEKLILVFLQNYLGLVKVPVTLRTCIEDEKLIFALLKNLDPPKFTFREFISREKAVKDCVLIQRSYSFPALYPQQLFPLVLAAAVGYGRPIILSQEGGVLLFGTVQVIVREETVNGNRMLLIECRCFLPQKRTQSVNDDTEKSVREYTKHVFFIVTDLVDCIIKRQGIVAVISQNIPLNSVHTSLGCNHNWISLPDTEHIQSVCTLCNLCCEAGEQCPYNRIMGTDLRECGCKTTTPGCVDCGICVTCAKGLWDLRTELRPMTMSFTSTADIYRVTLNPVTFNEIEIDVVSGMCPPMCLSSEGNTIMAAPGQSRTFSSEVKIGLSDVRLALEYNKDLRLCIREGDRLKIRLSAPKGSISSTADKSNTAGVTPTFVQYYTDICKEALALQEAGVVCYKYGSKPVAQFVAPKPFSEALQRFSIKILCGGSRNSIGIGMCPRLYASNNMPGWKSKSFGYHADDGGIFIEKGNSQTKIEKCSVGDVMAVEFDVKSGELKFFKNDQEVYKMTVPGNGKPLPDFYPMIGLHSEFECVKLLEIEPWTPLDPNARKEIPKSIDFTDVDGLIISPPKTITLSRLFYALCSGQIIFHNTTKTPIGYKLEPARIFKARDAEGGGDHSTGIIEANDTKVIMCHAEQQTSKLSDITIEWIELQKNKTYPVEELKKALSGKCHVYRLNAIMKHTDYNRGLARVVKGEKRKDYVLEIFKNSELIEQYWITPDNYYLTLPFDYGQYVIRYPKCPSLNFPEQLEKGMIVFIALPNTTVAEAVIIGVEPSGKYQYEYSPEGDRDNKVIIGDFSTMEVKGYKEGDPILMYRSDASQKSLSQTYMYAPPYLVPEECSNVLKLTDSNWMSTILNQKATCSADINRLTVQEQMMVVQSRNLIGWLDGYGDNGSVEDTFAFLPNTLNTIAFLYPGLGMFADLNIHRLCFYADQLLNYQQQKKIHLRNPLHFMDMHALTPKSNLSADVTFACKFQAWVYIALIAKQLLLPSHKSILPEKDIQSFSRSEIEHMLFDVVHQFASISSLFAAQYGGLQNQSNPVSGTKSILQLSEGQCQPLIKYKGNPITDPSNLIQDGALCICKAHKISMATTDYDLESELDISYDLFHPYMENVNSVDLRITKKIAFPGDFFQKMPNLENFSITGCFLKEKQPLPGNSATLKELRYINISHVNVKELPSDIFRAEKLKEVHFQGIPLVKVKNIMQRFSKPYVLTKLTLNDIKLEELPSDIKNLVLLEELSLDHNPLTRLPISLKELKKLRVLSIQGFPLMNFDGEVESLTRQQYKDWHKDNPAITNFLSSKKVEALFDEVDRRRRGTLDVSEIAQLNLKLFFLLPRFGTDGFNEKFGGWPDVIFKLTQLKELYFGYQGITLIPSDLKALTQLEVMDLQHCPLLETLSAKLGFMTNLRNINLKHCPSLRTPPHEVVSRGFESVKAYLKRLDGGFTTCRRTKLMFVGVGDAGKTSLLKALTSTSKKTSGTQNAMLTDGIDIKSWKVKVPEKGEIVYSAWDFAGQSVYYNTHQFFLTSRAVYLLLWNMRMGFQHAGLDFWLSSIACHAPDAPVLIIGTQADQIPKPEIEEKVIKNSYPQIQGFHYVSSIQGTGIKELEEQLIEITLQQPYLEEKIPQVWLNLEEKMLKMRKDSSILSWSQVEQIARDEGIYHEQDLKEAISFLDNLGTVQYFDTDFLRDKVVVDPQWIVKVMACVVSVRASAIQKNDGRFEHSQLDAVWEKYDADLRPWLLSLTEEFDLTFPLPGQPLNIVPCLLPMEPPEEFRWPDLDPLSSDGISENKIVYKFVYLPGGLFNRLQVRLFNFSDGKMIWKKGSYLQKNQHLALIQQNSDRQLTVTVQGPRPENVLFLIHEVLESLITESYHGVTYDYYLPCPDCIAKGSDSFRNPYLFKASIIKKGKNMNAPFLQCTENFHTVAMTQLLAIMPDDRNSDFDIHLQNSISALQSINNDIEYDVAVLYCQADIPPKGKKDLINPKEVKNDLLAWNYSVWMPESVTPDRVSEMTLQLKNSKVVVCCMSDQFEKDETCHNMFLYITNQLRKKILIVVVRPSMAWQETDLGMKIGDAFVCMIRSPDRYKAKIVDLRDMVEKTLIAMEKDKQRPADVFISYCWQNSKKAVEKGTKIKDKSSIGAVDPRDIKDFLTDKKVSCWIDVEKIGTYGLYLDIAMGLQSCKLLVCCVSDEYSDSENCMMELKYAVLNLKLPVIVVPVGTGSRWKSKVGIFVVKAEEEAPEISMQLEDNKEKLLTKVKEILATKCKTEDEAKEKQQQEKERQKNLEKKAQDLKFSYQEEYELLQRKFLRHVTMITTKLNFEVLPRLLVFDFVKAGSPGKNTEKGTPRRPRTGKERRKAVILDDEDEDWQAEEFCIKVMCEHEEGWHVSEKSLNLSARSSEEVYHVLREAAPYLSRLYAVLKQSSVNLNCLRGKTGDSYCSYIDKKGLAESNFGRAYEAIHHFVADHAGKRDLMQKLHRCHLPSGKILWLCDNHSKGNRITKISLGGASSRSTGLVTLTREDDFLKEHMRKHPTVLKLLKRPEPIEEEKEEKEEEKEKEEENDKDEQETEQENKEMDEKTVENAETRESKEGTPPVGERSSEEVKNREGTGEIQIKKNAAIKQGGPINRGGSPCPSKGGVKQNETPKSNRKVREKGEGSPLASKGAVQQNDTPKRTGKEQEKAEAKKNTDRMQRSTTKPEKKDASSSVCVIS
ncbi:uncharacterized protein LOC133189455 [Saccostrea echinata]|uniref:uncharacterized protein LOC133189455 n=1 Tax=Saccostrea echinata TaxID=191078 RepID=UPI002A82D1FB|nr:uncharacterized protein LOC133189455 [Saccostrea echinata]